MAHKFDNCKHTWAFQVEAGHNVQGNAWPAYMRCTSCETSVTVADVINMQLYKHVSSKEFWISVGALFVSGISLLVSVLTFIYKQ